MSNGPFRWSRLLKGFIGIAILILIAKALEHYGSEVTRHVSTINLPLLATGLVLCIGYRILNSCGWVVVLRSMNQAMPFGRGMRIWLLAESMRWLPGSVWGFCSRVYQAAKAGIPPAIASASLPLELLFTIMSWSVVAAIGVVCSGHSFEWRHLVQPRIFLIGCGGVIILGGITAFCFLLFPESRFGTKLRLLWRELVALRSMELRRGMLALVLLLYTSLCCLNGLAFYFVICSVSATPPELTAVIGINACGWLMGFLAIGAPGGIGVREAGVAFLLSTMMPLPTAIAATVLWRLVMIMDEMTCLGMCLGPNLMARYSWKSRTALPENA